MKKLKEALASIVETELASCVADCRDKYSPRKMATWDPEDMDEADVGQKRFHVGARSRISGREALVKDKDGNVKTFDDRESAQAYAREHRTMDHHYWVEPADGNLDETAPPGFEKAVKAMKKDKDVENPFAVAWSMKKKGYKPSDESVKYEADGWFSDIASKAKELALTDIGGRPGILIPTERATEYGHAKGEPSDDFSRWQAKREKSMREADDDREDEECPECGAPPGKHDPRCPLFDEMDASQPFAPSSKADLEERDDEDEEDLLFGSDEDDEACPGCGSRPGEGVDPTCDDPMGCGYWKEFKASVHEEPKGQRSLRSMLGSPSDADDEGVRRGYGEREGIETERGEWIENPFWDESGSEEVDPEEHYGDAFKRSSLAKRLRWGEASDYDGLPLTEAAMFDRFDTLVGCRRDGTFDPRGRDEHDGVRSLVKKVIMNEAEARSPASTPKGRGFTVDWPELPDVAPHRRPAEEKDKEDEELDEADDVCEMCDETHDGSCECSVDEMKLGVAGRAPFDFSQHDEDRPEEPPSVPKLRSGEGAPFTTSPRARDPFPSKPRRRAARTGR